MVPCICEMVNAVLTQRRSGQASRGKAAGALLLGVKRRDWRARPQAAHWLGRELAWRSEVAYWAFRRKRRRMNVIAGNSVGVCASRPACGRPNFSTRPIASSARAGFATAPATVCASLWRATSGFRPVWRCISTRPAKCANRLAARRDNRRPVTRRRGGRRSQSQRPIRAEATLLRDSRLSPVRRSSSPR
jgi:hypothetical protein